MADAQELVGIAESSRGTIRLYQGMYRPYSWGDIKERIRRLYRKLFWSKRRREESRKEWERGILLMLKRAVENYESGVWK